MGQFRVGVKIYSYDWYWKYGLDYRQAAQVLKEQGMNFVIAQNEYIPSKNTAVDAEVPEECREAFENYSDQEFVKALQEEGIEYYASALMFFNPEEMYRFGNVPVDMYGNRVQKEDWYIGACPGSDAYVEHKIQQIIHCVRELKPDGIFLGFMRFPGFWETWLPGTKEQEWNECCFCDTCMKKFSREKGVQIPDEIKEKGLWIRKNAYQEYVEWKSDVLFNIAERIKREIRIYKENTKLILNTLPFDRAHFGDAGRNIFGQDLEKLSTVIDVFEVMGYHQILNRPEVWVADVGRELKERLPHSEVVCTIQVSPSYLDGMHAGKGRTETIHLGMIKEEIKQIGRDTDGIVVYAWADFLKQRMMGDEKIIEIVKETSRGNTSK